MRHYGRRTAGWEPQGDLAWFRGTACEWFTSALSTLSESSYAHHLNFPRLEVRILPPEWWPAAAKLRLTLQRASARSLLQQRHGRRRHRTWDRGEHVGDGGEPPWEGVYGSSSNRYVLHA